MERIEFTVQGSSGQYRVLVESNDGQVRMFCTCAAGDNGQACKHRIGLLDGVLDGIIKGTPDDIERVRRLTAGTPIEAAYRAVQMREADVERARKAVRLAKGNLSKAMRG